MGSRRFWSGISAQSDAAAASGAAAAAVEKTKPKQNPRGSGGSKKGGNNNSPKENEEKVTPLSEDFSKWYLDVVKVLMFLHFSSPLSRTHHLPFPPPPTSLRYTGPPLSPHTHPPSKPTYERSVLSRWPIWRTTAPFAVPWSSSRTGGPFGRTS